MFRPSQGSAELTGVAETTGGSSQNRFETVAKYNLSFCSVVCFKGHALVFLSSWR